MQFAPKMPPAPCVKCGITKVKAGGITGMCKACRAAFPSFAQGRRDAYFADKQAFREGMEEWLEENTVPDPFGRPGIRRAKPGAGMPFDKR